jgi:RNA polymerase sigma factor (sigma-70 family)
VDYAAMTIEELAQLASAQDEQAIAELMRRFYQGDDQALARLWECLLNRLLGLARYHLRRWALPEDVAEDLVDDLVIRLLRTRSEERGRWQEGQQVWPWLSTLLRNLVIDHGRRLGRQPTVSLPDEGGEDGGLEEIAVDPDPGPLDALLTGEGAEQLRRCIEGLAPALRELVELRYLHGMQQTEIAAQLGRSDTWVSTRLERARRLLRDCLEQGEGH